MFRNVLGSEIPSAQSESSSDDVQSSSDDEFMEHPMDDPAFIVSASLDEVRQSHEEEILRRLHYRCQVRLRRKRNMFNLLDSFEVRRTYRMSRTQIEHLCRLVAVRIQPGVTERCANGMEAAGCSVVTVLERVLISLRMLAGASYLDLKMIHGVAKSTLYAIFGRFYYAVSALSTDRSSLFMVTFPSDPTALKSCADGFQRLRCNREELYGCVGALDGLCVRIRRPSPRDAGNITAYYSRKGYFCVNVQAICDSGLVFTFVSVETPGSTHDSSAFMYSKFGREWIERNGEGPFYIAADEAYGYHSDIVIPWSGRALGEGNQRAERSCFNYYFSAGNRNVIERAFGVLYSRFGIFWRVLSVPLADVPRLITCCVSLHNFIMRTSDEEEVLGGMALGNGPGQRRNEDNSMSSGYNLELNFPENNSSCVRQVQRARRRATRREKMTAALARAGLRRPGVDLEDYF